MPNAAEEAVVLIADDSEISREVLSSVLSAEGYRVICAEDGDQALELIEKTRINLVLLDVLMPGKNGFEVCRTLKSRAETLFIPVVLVTGLSKMNDRIEGITCGADDFLSKPVNYQELLARTRALLRLKEYTDELENAETVLFSLALSIEAKDPYTRGHCDRLSTYATAMAEHLHLPAEQCVALRRAGVIHDVGKIAVPEHILLKKGSHTPDEWKVIKQHPVIGERICAPLKSFRHVLPIIRHHHEKQDGSGYPDGLKGSEIPITARILQIADIYDALTTDRPYHSALPRREALSIMHKEAERGWWDKEIIEVFEKLTAADLNEYPNNDVMKTI